VYFPARGGAIQKFYILLALSAFILLPWLIRNIILSGYLIFPFEKIDIFAFDWKIPLHRVEGISKGILGFARLCDPRELSPERALACKTITSAMMAHPEMVGGFGRFDTRLMQIGRGRLVVKVGAEGYQTVGILPNLTEPSQKGVGIALKISDGDATESVRSAVMLEILRQLRILNKEDLAELAEFGPITPILNWRKIKVGESHPIFELERQE
jgi:L-asparaginase II